MDVEGGNGEANPGLGGEPPSTAPPVEVAGNPRRESDVEATLSPPLSDDLVAGFELRGVSKSTAIVQAIAAIGIWYASARVELWLVLWMRPSLGVPTLGALVLTRLIFAVAASAFGVLLAVYHGFPLASMGLRRSSLRGDAFYGLCAGVVGWVGALTTFRVLGSVRDLLNAAGAHLPPVLSTDTWNLASLDAIGRLVFVAQMTFSVIGEEAVYRAVVLPRAYRVVNRWWFAITVSTLLHVVIHRHIGVYTQIQIAAPILVFSYAYVKRRSIISSLVAHWVCNVMVAGMQ